MPRYIPVCLVLLWLGQTGGTVFAQTSSRTPPDPVSRQASAAGGRIRGVVHDDAGQRIGGANIIALGTTLAAARTDSAGRFDLALPPGEYILRANREGYTSTYREPVRVQTSVALEREITLIRQGPFDPTKATDVAGIAPLMIVPDTDDHSHSEAAWRLRQLTRTVLRDTAASASNGTGSTDTFGGPSAADSSITNSALAAASFIGRTDFTGQVNFITTSALSQTTLGTQNDWARGVAYAAVGAPVGVRGDWLIRGAMTAGEFSSWALVGEYDGRETETHAIHAGVSYSSQDLFASGPTTLTPVAIGSRGVGGVYGADRWQVTEAFQLEGGIRLDRYDYVETPTLVSQYAGTRVRITGQTTVVARFGNRMVAPGADEFLPPSTSGPWLPPQRTFSALIAGVPLQAERVLESQVGFDQTFGENGSRTFRGRYFTESTTNQVSTLFGLDDRSAVGHYYVSTPGNVEVQGWTVGIAGHLLRNVSGCLDYSLANADWSTNRMSRAVRWLAPSTVRRGEERFHDVTGQLSAYIPHTATQLSVVYRINTAFAGPSHVDRSPALAGRFNIEVRQELPYQPLRGGRLEVVFAARNLLRDDLAGGSIYDELLTVAPPLRLLGGVQVRF
jgi:hypothetical protein